MSKTSCKVCNDPILVESEALKCVGACHGYFHFLCGGLSDSAFKKLPATKKSKWQCRSCQDEIAPKTRSTSNNLSSDPETPQNINQQLKDIRDFMTSKFHDLSASIEFNNSMIQDFVLQVKELQKSNEYLKTSNAGLIQENLDMKKELSELKNDIIELKQYSRRSNFEITNLPEPESGSENVLDVLSKIDEVSDLNIVDNLVVAHRVPSFNKDKPKPIIVQVKSSDCRDILLKKLRSLKLTASKINPRFSDTPIFFNEHLTPELKNLFFHARKFKADQGYKFCWVRSGKIFLRKDESSIVLRVKSLDDLIIPASVGSN